jgi:hypothetical protein
LAAYFSKRYRKSEQVIFNLLSAYAREFGLTDNLRTDEAGRYLALIRPKWDWHPLAKQKEADMYRQTVEWARKELR